MGQVFTSDHWPTSEGSVGLVFEIVKATDVEVVLFPPKSRATAVALCGPFPNTVVFREIEYGEVESSTPTLFPSSLNCTPATPTLSDALAAMLMTPETVEAGPGEDNETVGRIVSGTVVVKLVDASVFGIAE